MKYLILILVSVASLAWAQGIPALELNNPDAKNMQLGLGKNVEGQPNLRGSYFGTHVNEDRSGPQDACPHCGPGGIGLASEPTAEQNGEPTATGEAKTDSGSGGEQK